MAYSKTNITDNQLFIEANNISLTLSEAITGSVILNNSTDAIEIQKPLTSSGLLTITKAGTGLIVEGDMVVMGTSTVIENEIIHNSEVINNNLTVKGDTYLGDNVSDKTIITGNLGVNDPVPTDPVTVGGIISSTSGGFKFPDGTIQTSAGTALSSFNLEGFYNIVQNSIFEKWEGYTAPIVDPVNDTEIVNNWFVYRTVPATYTKNVSYLFRGVNGMESVRSGYSIGDIGPGGGYVFITPTTPGNSTGKYFEAASTIAGTYTWKTSNTWTFPNNAWATGIGNGEANTALMTGVTHPAAQACRDYVGGGKTDWFLPSVDELGEVWTHLASSAAKRGLYGMVESFTWASTQSDETLAYVKTLNDLGPSVAVNKNNVVAVVPVRVFDLTDSAFISVYQEIDTSAIKKYIPVSGTRSFYASCLTEAGQVSGTLLQVYDGATTTSVANLTINAVEKLTVNFTVSSSATTITLSLVNTSSVATYFGEVSVYEGSLEKEWTPNAIDEAGYYT